MVNELLKLQEAEGLLEEQDSLARRVRKVNDIVEACRPTHGEEEVRDKLFRRLRKVLGSIFEGCQVRAYGSSGTAFGGRGSDVDVVVLTAEYLRDAAQPQPATATTPDVPSPNPTHMEHGQSAADDHAVRNTEKMRTCVLDLAARIQEQYKDEFAVVLAVVFKNVRVPLLKLKHNPTSIAVDVTVSGSKRFEPIFCLHVPLGLIPPCLSCSIVMPPMT